MPLLIAARRHGSAHERTADVVRQTGASGDTALAAAASARIAAIEAGSASGRVRFNGAASPSSERLAIEQLLASWDDELGHPDAD